MRHFLLIVSLLIFTQAHAGEYGKMLYDKVDRVHASGIEMVHPMLFIPTVRGSDSFVQQYQEYKPVVQNITRLYQERTKAISLTLQAATGKNYTLELVASHPTSIDAQIGYIDEHGRHAAPYETGLHYNGIVSGTDKSVAAMSVFANGEVMLFFSCGDGNFNMGKIRDESGRYVLYNTIDRLNEIPVTCHVVDTNAQPIDTRSLNKTTGDIECKKARIYWEVGFDIYTTLGSLSATQNYLTGVFNFMQSIYYNDGMAIEMSSMYIWTVADPYTRSHTSDAQFHFQRYWQAQKNSYHGDQAQLILDGVGWNGYGTVFGLCSGSAYAASNIYGHQQGNFPVWDVDIYLVSHETGHTFGAQHSHWCGWMTGPGGTCGAVDNCTTLEVWGIPGCSGCTALHDANGANFKGTIMSYCGGKLNFSEGFGPVIGSYLRSELSKASCLQPVISTDLVVQDICNNDGAIVLNYPANNFGVAPYTYTWTGGKTTKDISGLTAPGKYTVSIVDSNGCTVTDSAQLSYYAKPGDGQALSGVMPYCCKDTAFDVTISANLPTELTQCQTVAWLRSNNAISSYADLKTVYTNAGVNDILMSDNSQQINNATSAKLTISSPPTCISTTAYYYTPFVVKKTTTKKTYTTNASVATQLKNGNTVLGNSVTIPAEPILPSSVCEKAVPNITDTITVTISNYTGRANKLSIRVIGDEQVELFEKIDYPGDGVYRIPIVTNDHFQQMTVNAMDFNCSNGITCMPCSFNIQAKREVAYDALQPLVIDSSCVAGTSVFLSFGPDNCNLSIANSVKESGALAIYPNPAHDKISIKLPIDVNINDEVSLYINDAVGKKVLQADKLSVVSREFEVSLPQLAAGVYTVVLKADEGSYVHKLVIE